MATPAQERERPWSASEKPGLWDDIIIGSGMGGMTVAAILSRLGRRVLVLEQHDTPGGFTHTFQRKSWRWDVGVHAVGQVTKDAPSGRILSSLSGGRLEWASLGSVYERFHYPDGYEFGYPDSERAFQAALIERFPKEKAAVRKYFLLLHAAQASMSALFVSRGLPKGVALFADTLATEMGRYWLRRTTASVLGGLTGDARLKTVLTGQWGYYGLPPSRSPFGLHAMVATHYFRGAYFPVGGSASIARTLLATVAEAGGWTRVKAPVREVVIERGRAVGVRLDSGEEIRAGRVVSAAGVPATLAMIPDVSKPAAWTGSLSRLKPSAAHVCLYVGFEGNIRAAGATAANHWLMESWDHEWCHWNFRDREALAPVLYTSFGSLKDAAHDAGPRSRHTGEAITFVNYEDFAAWTGSKWKKRGGEYETLKFDLERRLLAQWLRRMPGLEPYVKVVELSTPLSTEHFARAAGGGIYGVESTADRYLNRRLRPRTPIRNLYLTGADVAGPGVMGAFGGGLITASVLEPLGTPSLLARAARG